MPATPAPIPLPSAPRAADGSWACRLRSLLPSEPLRSWKRYADVAKRRPVALRVADRLGRGKGRLRVLDRATRLPPAPLRPDLTDWHRHGLAAAWVGHATVLLRVGGASGATVLTDPVFSPRVGIGLGVATAGPKRLVAPAVRIKELPPVDVVLLSHAHFDHLDRPSLAALARRFPRARVVTAAGTADLVDDLGFASVAELKWGESADAAGLKITALPARHWGARTFYDTHRGYNGYLIEGAARRVLFAGDTADHRDFAGLGPVDLAIVPIGAYDPWIANHATPEQAWRMANEAGAARVLPVHHATFTLSREPTGEPIARLLAAAGDRADDVVVTRVGGQWTLADEVA